MYEGYANAKYDSGTRLGLVTIERIDNDQGYSPENCKWVSMKEQARNKRRRKNINVMEFEGRTFTLSEKAEELGISRFALRNRLQKWSKEKALTSPKTNTNGY